MATPQFQLVTTPLQIENGSPNSIKILTKDLTGAAIDVSSGYTCKVRMMPGNPARPGGGSNVSDISSSFSFAFSTTGVTLSMTNAQAGTFGGAHAPGTYPVEVWLSNDAFVTEAKLQRGSLQLSTTTDP